MISFSNGDGGMNTPPEDPEAGKTPRVTGQPKIQRDWV